MSGTHELIVERALLGALAAMVPVPFLDDALLRRARVSLLRDVATRAGLRLDDAALRALASERRAGFLRAGRTVLGRLVRGAAAPLRVAGRAGAALETFQLATLLDHYAQQHHAGLDLDVERARALREVFGEVIAALPFSIEGWRAPARHAAALRQAFDARWPRSGAAR